MKVQYVLSIKRLVWFYTVVSFSLFGSTTMVPERWLYPETRLLIQSPLLYQSTRLWVVFPWHPVRKRSWLGISHKQFSLCKLVSVVVDIHFVWSIWSVTSHGDFILSSQTALPYGGYDVICHLLRNLWTIHGHLLYNIDSHIAYSSRFAFIVWGNCCSFFVQKATLFPHLYCLCEYLTAEFAAILGVMGIQHSSSFLIHGGFLWWNLEA